MREFFPEAIVCAPEDLKRAVTCIPDVNDRHVVAAAIRGGANAIITQNTCHFPEECLRDYDLLCQHPDDFLIHQFHLNPDGILEKLDAQAAAIHKQRLDIIQRLKLIVPGFAALAESRTT